jgi:hypothetical protein
MKPYGITGECNLLKKLDYLFYIGLEVKCKKTLLNGEGLFLFILPGN